MKYITIRNLILGIATMLMTATIGAIPAISFASNDGNGSSSSSTMQGGSWHQFGTSPAFFSMPFFSEFAHAQSLPTTTGTTSASCPTTAFGHLIAPGFLANNGSTTASSSTSDCISFFPPGIARHFGFFTALAQQQSGGTSGTTTSGDATTTSTTTGPVMSNMFVGTTTSSGGFLEWNTNESANGIVFFGASTPLDTSSTATNQVTATSPFQNHYETWIRGLAPDTTYFFVVKMTDSSGNSTQSQIMSFTTNHTDGTPNSPNNVVTPAQFFTGVTTTPNTTSLTFNWSTLESTNGKAIVSSTSPVDVNSSSTMSASDSSFSMNHSLTVSGLTPNTTYHVVLRASDEDGGATVNSNEFTASTLGTSTATSTSTSTPTGSGSTSTSTAPFFGTVIGIVGTSTVDFTWTTASNSTGKIFYSSTTPVDVNASSTSSVSESSTTSGTMNHSLSLTGLSPNTTYYVVLQGTDTAGNVTNTNQFSLKTAPIITGTSTPTPFITNLGTSASSTSATVSWTTSETSDSAVFFGSSSPLDIFSTTTAAATDATMTLNHSLTLLGLTPSTTYFMVVRSTDPLGNSVFSSTTSFMTTAAATTTSGSSGSTATSTATSTSSTTIQTIVAVVGTSTVQAIWKTASPTEGTIFFSTSTPVSTTASSTPSITDSGSGFMTNHSISLTGLTPNTTYHLVVQSTDSSGNTTTSDEFPITTSI